MDILAAIKREERKLEKQLGKLNHQLNGVRAAAKALGGSAEREVVGVKKRVLSAAGRAAIAKAAKKRCSSWLVALPDNEATCPVCALIKPIVFQSDPCLTIHANSLREA